ncbi:MAG: AbrB family transcriptional regulator [Gammaproteobacteria bacterium]|jgi:antitoxin VapB|nr:AbrB family transcriptional regulator [Gammaproteobacteria bacterium]
MRATAKIQRHDHRQTLELPDGYELLADEGWVRRDEQSGEIILTPKPSGKEPERLARLFNLIDSAPLSADFLQERQNPAEALRNPLED